jgi:DNA sulfur modification protein DndD
MKINLLQFESRGLRSPDFLYNFEQNGKKRIHLLQMPNGTAKTTTLELFRACFAEKRWTRNEVSKFRRRGEVNKNGYFKIQIKFGVDIYWVQIDFDFEKETATYYTTPSTGGKKEGFFLPSTITSIIDENFIKLQFFDAEWAIDLFDSDETRAYDNIYDFCRLGVTDNLLKYFESFYSEQQKINRVSPKEQKELNTLISKEKNIKSKINKIRKETKDKKDLLSNQKKQFEKLANELNKFFENNKEKDRKNTKATEKLYGVKEKYKAKLKENIDTFKKFYPLLNEDIREYSQKFIDALDVLKLPEDVGRVFFEELISKGECVCGDHLTPEKIEIIRDKMKDILSDSTASELSSYKDSVRPYLKEDIVDLENLNHEINELKGDLDVADQELKDLKVYLFKNDPDLDNKRIEKDNLEKSIKDLNEYFQNTINAPWKSTDTPENTASLISLEEQRVRIEEKISKITNIEKLLIKKKKIETILKISIEETIKLLSQQLTNECNEKIKKMLTADPLYLKEIKKTLIIKDGKPGDKGSMGQMARVGYIFVTSLLEKTNFTFPLVVDSPVAGMDFAGRKNTATLLSQLTNQVIVFILDSEKAKFSNILKERCPNDVSYTTMYRYNDQTKFLDNSLPPSIYKSNNGLVVYDEDFFETFSIEDE